MKISVFGEILWDIFGEEKAIGGAPFNFAAHAVKMGAEVDFISAVGKDELGKEALAQCRRLAIPTGSIAITDKETGYCKVTLKEGTPEYNLVMGVAYDNIPVPEALGDISFVPELPAVNTTADKTLTESVFIPDVFYFGTLAARSDVSRSSLWKIIEREKELNPDIQVFLDINIRQNYYSDQLIDESLKAATILKISREEIGVLNLAGTPEEVSSQIMDKYPNLKMVIVTLDKDGAFAMGRDGKPVYAPTPSCKVVSTVGAGDSFSAGFLMSYLNTGNMKEALVKASALAGFVCERVEAIPDYPKALVDMLQWIDSAQ